MINHSGERFNKLMLVQLVSVNKHYKGKYLCLCDCGKTKIISINNLQSGNTKSCGCARKGVLNNFTHGYTKTKEYRTWLGMKTRCYNKNDKAYKRYGAKGIQICDKWKNSFISFLDDFGLAPGTKYSIDRIGGTSGNPKRIHYSCGKCSQCLENKWPFNCRWATPLQQQNNIRRNYNIKIDGKTKSVSEWSRIFKISRKTLCHIFPKISSRQSDY